MDQYFLAKKALVNAHIQNDLVIHVSNGYFQKIQPLADCSIPRNQLTILDGLVLPGMVNGHSHAFQVLLRGYADHPKDFRDWVDNYLYPLVLKLDSHLLSDSTTRAYQQMIRNGITSVGEFHYIHNLDGIKEGAEIVIDSALKTGIRQRLLYTGYDLGNKKGQGRFHRTVEEVLNSLDYLRTKYSETSTIHIGAAPHSLHGASPEMIRQLVKWAQENDEIAHIHLAEQQSDVEEARTIFNKRPVEVLKDLGVLSEHLAIVHGIWLEEDEIALMAEMGTKHVYNPLTNMYLGDGIANLPAYVKCCVPTSLGTDANISLNLIHEARIAEWLQRIKTLQMGILKRNGQTSPQLLLWDMMTKNGGKALNLPIGEIKENYFADFILINDGEISLIEENDLITQLTSSYSMEHGLLASWVGGNQVFCRD